MILSGDTNTLIYEVDETTEDMELIEILATHMNVSSRLIRKCKKEKNIFVNDRNISMNAKMRKKDIIKVIFNEERNNISPEKMKLDIVYEDEDLIVVNKDPFLVVHPTAGHPTGTLSNGLVDYAIRKGENYKVRLINRLDRDTSGLVLIAKNSFAQHIVSEQMKSDTVIKRYLAVVHGNMENSGIINEPIEREEEGSMIRIVRDDGKPSETHYTPVEQLENATLVSLTLKTGRTHQIRVHMKHLGHILIGDSLYGSFEDVLINRQALHAEYLEFDTPRNGRVMLHAKLPKDIEELLSFLRK